MRTNRLSRRFGKPTTAGYVVLGAIAILILLVVAGVLIGGGAGALVDAVAGFLIVVFIFLMFGTTCRAGPETIRAISFLPSRRGPPAFTDPGPAGAAAIVGLGARITPDRESFLAYSSPIIDQRLDRG